MFHTRVLEMKSRNLDTFFAYGRPCVICWPKTGGAVIWLCWRASWAITMERGISTRAGAYDLAQTTDTPAVLLVNSRGMSLSLIADIKGFLEYKKDSGIRGVIFNRMSSMLYPRMKKLTEEELGIPCYGYVPELGRAFLRAGTWGWYCRMKCRI